VQHRFILSPKIPDAQVPKRKFASFGHGHRGVLIDYLNPLFGKIRVEFLWSRNARALGMQAQSDLGPNVLEFKDTETGRKAKEECEKYKGGLDPLRQTDRA
jgi:hypothetical protein